VFSPETKTRIVLSALSGETTVAAAIAATDSLRNGSSPRDIPRLDPEIITYFTNNQVK